MERFEAYGKCILAGEYGVLRGGQAVVCPLKEQTVTLEFPFPRPGFWIQTSDHAELCPFPHQESVRDFLACRGVEMPLGMVLRLRIPLAQGLGSSAAISVALAKAFAPPSGEAIFDFALALEQRFHGTSSGVDVAGALSDRLLLYQREPLTRREVVPVWMPHLLLSSSGERGYTQGAIAHVADLWKKEKGRAQAIEAQMAAATQGVLGALERPDGHALFAAALAQAGDCFVQWGLVTEAMERATRALFAAGAWAVKPTGSGGGGMLLSFWDGSHVPALPFPALNVMKNSC